MEKRIDPETPLEIQKLQKLKDKELTDLQTSLNSALLKVLENADAKEEDIDEEISKFDQENNSFDSDQQDLFDMLQRAKQIRENKNLLLQEVARRCGVKSGSSDNITSSIALLKEDFENKLQEQGLSSIEDLDETISNFRADLENATSLNDVSEMETLKQELDLFLGIREIYDKFAKVQKQENQSDQASQIKQLEDLMQDGLIELQLYFNEEDDFEQKFCDLEKKLAELTKAYNFEKVKFPQRAEKTQENIEKAKLIIQYAVQIREYNLSQTNHYQCLPPKPSIQNQIDSILTKYKLEGKQKLEEQFAFIQQQYDKAKREVDKNKYQAKLDDFKEALQLYLIIESENENKFRPKHENEFRPKQEEDKQKLQSKENQNFQQQQQNEKYIKDIYIQSESDLKKDQRLESSLIYAQGVSKMCDQCFEKTFFNLLYYACLKFYNQEDTLYKQQDYEKIIEDLKEKLLQQQKNENIEEKQLINCINSVRATENPEQIIESIIPVIRFIKQFSFQELFTLEQELDHSGKLMNNKDIILLLGTTGVGKSTTVHYLAGSEMSLIKIGTISHIEASCIYNPDLQKVKSSWKAKSETRFVTPINIKHDARDYIIADSPGSEDTKSAEIEFSNQLGVKKAIGLSNSVRPVILFSFKNFGNRCEKLKELLNYFGSQFNNIEQNAKSFTYIFTNVTPYTKGTIKQQLYNIKSNLTMQDSSDNIFMIMLNDMIQKAENEDIVELDPLDPGARLSILQKIIKKKPIFFPGEVIKANVSQQSKQKVVSQLILHENVIMKAFLCQGGDIINFKLGEIKQLTQLYPDDEGYQLYFQQCIEKVHNFIEDQYKSAIEQISQKMQINVELKEQDIQIYMNKQNLMKSFDQCISQFLCDKNTKNSDIYVVSLNEQVQNTYQKILDSRTIISDNDWFDFLKKLKQISSYDSFAQIYLQAINKFIKQVQLIADKCIKVLQLNDQSFENNVFNQSQIMQKQSDIDSESVQLSMLQNQLNQINKEDDSISDNLQYHYEFACKFRQIQKAAKKVANIGSDFKEKIMQENSDNQQNKDYNSSNIEKDLKNKYNNLTLLKQLTIFQNTKIDQKIFQLEKNISNYVYSKTQAIEKIFDSIEDKKNRNQRHLRNLKRALQSVKQLQWFESYNQQSYKDTLENIEEKFTEYILELKLEVQSNKIGLNNLESIKALAKAQAEINEYREIIKITGININLQDVIQFKEKQIQINQIIESNKDKLKELENLEIPLDICQLKNLQEYYDFLTIINDKSSIFGDSCNYEEIMIRIKGDDKTSLIDKQYKLINSKLNEIAKIIEIYIKGSSEISENEVYQKIELLESILMTDKELSSNKKLQTSSMEYQQKSVNQQLQNIYSSFCNLLSKQLQQDQTSQQFIRTYDILGRITLIDQFYQQFGFKKEFESLQQEIKKNPTNNVEMIKQLFDIQDFEEIKSKLCTFDKNNKNEYTKAHNIIYQETKKYLEIIKYKRIDEENKSLLDKQLETAIVLKKIDDSLNQYLLSLNIKQQIKNLINRHKQDVLDMLKNCTSLKSSRNYDSADHNLNIVNIIYDCYNQAGDSTQSIIDDHYLQDLKEQLINEENELKQDLNKYIEKFKTMEIIQFEYNQPKKLYENIQKMAMINSQILIDLKNNVMENIYSQLKNIDKDLQQEVPQITEIKKQLSKIEKLKPYIPLEWWSDLQIKIQALNDNLQSQLAQEKILNDEISESNNITFFIQKLEKTPQLIRNDTSCKWLNNSLRQLIKDCKQNIKQSETISQGIMQFIEIEKYIQHKEVLNIVNSQKNEYNMLRDQISDYIMSWSEEVKKIFEEQQEINNIQKQSSNQTQLQSHFSLFKKNNFQMGNISDSKSQQQIKQENSINKLNYLIIALLSKEQTLELKQDSLQLRGLLQQNIFKINQSAMKYIENLQQNLNQNIIVEKLQVNAVNCNKYLSQLLNVDFILSKIRELDLTMILNLGQSEEFIVSKNELCIDQIQKIGQILEQIIKILNEIQLITERTEQLGGKDRTEHYQYIQSMLNTINQIAGFGNEITNLMNYDFKTCQDQCSKILETKILELIASTKNLSKSVKDQDKQQMKIFQKKFYHLKSLQENINIHQGIIIKSIEEIDEAVNLNINEKCQFAQKISSDISQFASCLVKLQIICDCVPSYKQFIESKILDLLKNFKQNTKGNTKLFNVLALKLKETPEGINLTSSCKYFEGIERSLWNQKVQKIDIDQVLSELKGENIDTVKIKSRFEKFDKIYKKTIKDVLANSIDTKEIDFSHIIGEIKYLTNSQQQKWTSTEAETLPDLMAYIFSLWTLSSAENYFDADETDANKNYYLRMPHAAQIVSIFRIMGIGYSSFKQPIVNKVKDIIFGKSIVDNLVQIKTGEGKSITLAVVSIIFSLHGFNVRVACYSEYLSMRDYQSFQDIFKLLCVQDNIQYGTFNQACEAYINKDGNIRELFLQKILGTSKIPQKGIIQQKQNPLVLLIDEVDVFFSKEFYGAQYRPQATINHPSVEKLIDYIWQSKNDPTLLNLDSIKYSEEYKQCQSIFNPAYANLLQEAVKDMICDVQDYYKHDYILENGMIGYKEQDNISFEISYGYKTTFAYYQKFSEGLVTQSILSKQKTIGINCGEFSFSEIPKNYSIILGVTGTLSELTQSEQNIIKNVYNIQNFTYLPSVYGNSRLSWESKNHVIIADNSRYYLEIVNDITEKLENRAVIVFFNNDKNLQKFLTSKQFKDQAYQSIQILNERLNFIEKENRIKLATRKGYITLATRSFGRGADFICQDGEVEKSGGIHIILTFFSNEVSEEVQLKGRTARQGNRGSIQMILLQNDLSRLDISEEEINRSEKSEYYDLLTQKRNHFQMKIQQNETSSLEAKIKAHLNATDIVQELLKNGSDSKIFKFLNDLNRGRSKGRITKTLIMMDATGSMSNLLNKTKNAVSSMFEEASQILKLKGLDQKQFEIQFGCYRNYGSMRGHLLQFSTWESNPQSLTKFMESIVARDGEGNEAIEIGLWHANQEADLKEGGALSQVFIIGDMPPNNKEEVIQKRDQSGEQWQQTKFKDPTFYQEEYKRLKQKNIQVFTFYVSKNAQASFEEIAKATGGTSQFLDVESEKGQKVLVELFVTEILRKVGNDNGGKGEEFVKAYKQYKQK